MQNEIERKLYPEERRAAIKALIAENGRMSVEELTVRFDVSKVTVRGDLGRLEQEGIVKRTHGGAIALAVDASRSDPEFFEREQIHSAEKARIGVAGATLVQSGMTVLFDASTTALQVARQLKQQRDVTIVTNCLPLAMVFDDAPAITVFLLGGIVRPSSWAVVGPWVAQMLAQINIDLAFFGCKGITTAEGVTDVNAFLVETKRAMVQAARRVVIVADHQKFGRVAFASYASIGEVDVVVTDEQAPADELARLREQGVEVMIA